MQSKRKGQIALILAIIGITLYNVLPTLFYYTKPLQESVPADCGKEIGERIADLESRSLKWLTSYCKLIGVKPLSLGRDESGLIAIEFKEKKEALRFRKAFPRAGSLIPNAFEQLLLAPREADTTVYVLRRLEAPLPPLRYLAVGSAEWDKLASERLQTVRKALARTPLSDDVAEYGAAFGVPSAPFARYAALMRNRDLELSASSRALLKKQDRVEPGHPLFAPIEMREGKLVLLYQQDVPRTEQVEQLGLREVAEVARLSGETVVPIEGGFAIPLTSLPDASGALLFSLADAAQAEADLLATRLPLLWEPEHPDLQADTFPIVRGEPTPFCLSIQTEGTDIALTLHGLNRLAQTYRDHPDSEPARQFQRDLTQLHHWLQTFGFSATEGLVFVKRDLAPLLLSATRELFRVVGTEALLELSTVEQRLLARNRIETAQHEELVKWRDDSLASSVSLNPAVRFDIPEPPQSVFWDNVLLNARKYFRGDDRKILRWGLDLSGGKSVQIELRDPQHRVVTGEAELRQGINELYQRVNKLGVSEVSIRRLGDTLSLEFPGQQALSASELIRGSSMAFHVVNEQFTARNPRINSWLQGIWNEATITHRTSPEDLEQIAKRHSIEGVPLDTCKVVALRGDTPLEWGGQSHPLLLVFSDPVLEGAHLDNIHPGYDAQRGNYLSFDVKSRYNDTDPREHFHKWTSQYSRDAIAGTPLETYSDGRGWRMAVLLNGTVISAPTLNDSGLRESAMISGSFTPREVNQLAADLKAGSLTYTPHILSETNISPELGQADRLQGIGATLLALLLVIGAMVGYYRYAGWIASVAVLFNLLIIWAALQNIGATLSLAGIAGIILTVGMAVDANVLVFERMKEEYAVTKNYASSLFAGYQKAFSAILDSNVTTILAALILLNFDAGPIKGFALTLMIGIASSMFTALFMTRVYFEGNPHRPLKMNHWIGTHSFNYLKRAPAAFLLSALLILGGGALLFAQRDTLLGMDFTGGYSVELSTTAAPESITAALTRDGIAPRELQIRSHTTGHHRLLLSPTLEQQNRPFAQLPSGDERIAWVARSLQSAHIDATVSHWTSVSGQMSESMRTNALLALTLAFASIFVYLVFRFEFAFATAALLCLFHDVLLTLASLGILHLFGLPIQIDLNTVAAIMTIIGYSLNDTIIIFDRIREEIHLHGASDLPALVNRALNTTLSRTAITSGTTLLVLLALLFVGGPSLFNFSLVMTLGVLFGTLSSWFIASPLFLLFHRRSPKFSFYSFFF